jgi:hypothetical protein
MLQLMVKVIESLPSNQKEFDANSCLPGFINWNYFGSYLQSKETKLRFPAHSSFVENQKISHICWLQKVVIITHH